jgi:hypothetical protein
MYGYRKNMLYGERLKMAMDRRSEMLGQEVTRKDIATVAECSVQNIGMILNNSKGVDQTLTAKRHAAVADYLKVNPQWLLDGTGPMEVQRNAPSTLTPAAIEIAALFDMIPVTDKIKRAQAFNAATMAILQVLQSGSAK